MSRYPRNMGPIVMLALSMSMTIGVTKSNAVINQKDECAVAVSKPLAVLYSAATKCAWHETRSQDAVLRAFCDDKAVAKCIARLNKVAQQVADEATECTTESKAVLDATAASCQAVADGAYADYDAYTGNPGELPPEPPSGSATGVATTPRRCAVIYSKAVNDLVYKANACAQNYAAKGVNRDICVIKYTDKCVTALERLNALAPDVPHDADKGCSPTVDGLRVTPVDTCEDARDKAFTYYGNRTGNPAPETNQ